MKKKTVLQIIASRIAGFFGIRFYNMCYAATDLSEFIEPVRLLTDLQVRVADADDMRQIINRSDRTIQENFNRCIAVSSICYVAAHDDTIAGYAWINQDIIELTGMYMGKIPRGGVYF